MKIFEHIKSDGFLSPSTVEGAILYGILFALAAWLLGLLLREMVQRALARDKHDHFDQTYRVLTDVPRATDAQETMPVSTPSSIAARVPRGS